MSTDYRDFCFRCLGLPAFQDLRDYLRWQVPRKRGDVERCDGTAAFRIDIRESVGDRDFAKIERIIDDRREEIDG